jgi:hypothetical protein
VLAQPGGGRVEQRRERLGVALELEEPEPSPLFAAMRVEGVVDVGADAPDDTAVAAREESPPLRRG